MEKTKVNFDVDMDVALRYLSKCAKSDKEIKDWGFAKFAPKRTKRKGMRPGVSDTNKEDNKWTISKIPTDPKDLLFG